MNFNELIAFWQKQNIKTSDELAVVLASFSINFSYHSGRISNDNITYNDICEIFKNDGIKSYTGDLRTLFEIRNSKNAYEYILFSFGQKAPITEEFVKLVQNILTANTYDTHHLKSGEHPGTYRRYNYFNGKIERRISANELHEQISRLVEIVFIKKHVNPLIIAAEFLAKLESIHPFFDGNGRASRLLMNYYLLLEDYPPIIIHDDDREKYYDILEEYNTTNEITPLFNFLIEQLEKTWNNANVIKDVLKS